MSTSSYPPLFLFIDGDRIGADDRRSTAIENPVDRSVIGQLPHATDVDLDRAVAASARMFSLWKATTPLDRSRILARACELIRHRLHEIATILTLEQGKPLAEAKAEVAFAADCIEWYGEEGKRAYGRLIPGRTSGVEQVVRPEPIGPAIAFTPWNFPALTPARKIGGALAAGCTLTLKAAEETPGTAIALVQAFADAGLPDGVLNLVFGDPVAISERLIASPYTRKLSFTGSTAVGRQLMHRSIDGGMMRTTMELGGHAPVLIFDDVDVEQVAALTALGKFRNAGQVCIAPTRFYVHRGIVDAFTRSFVAQVEQLRVGDGLDPATTMGPLLNARRVEAIERFVVDTRKRGGVVHAGGRRSNAPGSFFEPTVVNGIGDDALVMTQEPFGPIAPIVPFDQLDDVLRRANSLPYGLAAYAFTGSARRAGIVAEALAAGMVGINTLSISSPETPFGGVKESGHGSESGIEGLQAYQDVKLVARA